MAEGVGVVPTIEGEEKKRKYVSHEEAIQKVRKTIGWYNHNGGLEKPIIYKDVREVVEACNPRETLKVLKQLEEKAGTIRNPTAWLRGACEKVGPDLDPRVKKTITWWNKHGGLTEEIRYDDVKSALQWMEPGMALKLLKGLDGKTDQVRNPTGWICGAAKKFFESGGGGGDPWGGSQSWAPAPVQAYGKGAMAVPPRAGSFSPGWQGGKGSWQGDGSSGGRLDPKVSKTINWYNKFGGLQSEISYKDVAPVLAAIGVGPALQVLKGLAGKEAQIRNPTAWINSAVTKMMSQG